MAKREADSEKLKTDLKASVGKNNAQKVKDMKECLWTEKELEQCIVQFYIKTSYLDVRKMLISYISS